MWHIICLCLPAVTKSYQLALLAGLSDLVPFRRDYESQGVF
jgi:hypothetical protein